MNVILKKQYSLRQQPFYNLLGLKVGLVDADQQNRSFYTQKLDQANLAVVPCVNLLMLQQELLTDQIHAVVFSPSLEQMDKELLALKWFIEQNPQLPVITMAKTIQEMQLDAIMRLGTRFHINRDFSHPRDLLIALEQILTVK